MGGYHGFGSILLKEIEEKKKKTSRKRCILTEQDIINLDEEKLDCYIDDYLNDVGPDEIHPDETEEEF